VTIENCGADVTFEQAPDRVVLLKSSSVPFLHELGVMDRVTARAGQYPDDYYDDETVAELDAIPLLTD
jgi:iron complex transport system substrate-binding protein